MTLYSGMRGDNVRDLQQMLNAHGYELDEDGIFGVLTKNAVMDYQRRHGLKIDGIAGIKTLTRLMSVTTEPEPVIITAAGTVSERAVRIAESYIGVKETRENRGPEIDRWLRHMGIDFAAPWCMAFVQACFREAAEAFG